LETNGKLIYSNNKEVGGERASLANSPLRIEGSGGLTIDKYREGGAGDAGMNEINESGREAHPVKRSSDEIPVDAVKSLGEIKLEEKSLVFQLLRLKEWMISCVMIILEEICLFLIKAA
jgi:hypothetical protein